MEGLQEKTIRTNENNFTPYNAGKDSQIESWSRETFYYFSKLPTPPPKKNRIQIILLHTLQDQIPSFNLI